MSALLPCPFCGGAAMHMPRNYVIGCKTCGVWMADNRKDDWNRRTQPEATAPAQDLSAAITVKQCLELETIGAEWMSESGREVLADWIEKQTASSANALSAGDSEKQRIALIAAVQNYLVDVVRSFGDVSCAAYISTWHKPETINAAILQSQNK